MGQEQVAPAWSDQDKADMRYYEEMKRQAEEWQATPPSQRPYSEGLSENTETMMNPGHWQEKIDQLNEAHRAPAIDEATSITDQILDAISDPVHHPLTVVAAVGIALIGWAIIRGRR